MAILTFLLVRLTCNDLNRQCSLVPDVLQVLVCGSGRQAIESVMLIRRGVALVCNKGRVVLT